MVQGTQLLSTIVSNHAFYLVGHSDFVEVVPPQPYKTEEIFLSPSSDIIRQFTIERRMIQSRKSIDKNTLN